MRKSLAGLLASVVLGFWAVSAQASPLLDFNIDAVHPATASISYAGGGAALVGADISVDSILGIDTPANDGSSLAITDGILKFTTGGFTSGGPGVWNFGGGGSITLTGGILSLPNNTLLLSGEFLNATVVAAEPPNSYKVTISVFTDTKDDRLAGYYGLAGVDGWMGALQLGFYATAVNGGFESTRVTSGSLSNQPVPEPGTMLLLGTGVLGLVGLARRRK